MFTKKSVIALLFLSIAICARAGAPDTHPPEAAAPAPGLDARFDHGTFSLSLVSGALFSPVDWSIFPHSGTSFDYTQTEIRGGLMLNSPWDASIFSGNFEALLGLGGGAVIFGPGTALGNADLFIRYNFVQKGWRVVPYFQLGAGLFVSDAARDETQRNIGRTLEATLQTSLGLSFLVTPKWSFEVEGVFQHISNANTADRNVGVNALGGLLGVTRSF